MTRGKTLATMMGMLAMASAMGADMAYGTGRTRSVSINGNFSGKGGHANLKKNRKKPVTMRKPKSKKRKH